VTDDIIDYIGRLVFWDGPIRESTVDFPNLVIQPDDLVFIISEMNQKAPSDLSERIVEQTLQFVFQTNFSRSSLQIDFRKTLVYDQGAGTVITDCVFSYTGGEISTEVIVLVVFMLPL